MQTILVDYNVCGAKDKKRILPQTDISVFAWKLWVWKINQLWSDMWKRSPLSIVKYCVEQSTYLNNLACQPSSTVRYQILNSITTECKIQTANISWILFGTLAWPYYAQKDNLQRTVLREQERRGLRHEVSTGYNFIWQTWTMNQVKWAVHKRARPASCLPKCVIWNSAIWQPEQPEPG